MNFPQIFIIVFSNTKVKKTAIFCILLGLTEFHEVVHVYVCVCMYICVCVCIYMYMCVYIYNLKEKCRHKIKYVEQRVNFVLSPVQCEI